MIEDRLGVAEIGHAAHAAQASVAVAVVKLTLLRIGQDGVGFGGFLEAMGRLLVAGIAVRVVLHRQHAVGLFQFLLRDGFFNAQDFVKAPFGGRHSLTLV